jgi:hypothetical protein
MATASASASDLVMLGECLHALQNPQVYRPDLYAKEVDNFCALLERVGMKSTRRLAMSLNGRQLPTGANGLITLNASSNLASIVHPIATRVYEEISDKSFRECDPQLPEKLLSLPTALGKSLEPHQDALRLDTEVCLRARLYRPAIVSSWSLCYDLVRWWVYLDSQRLADFNSLLSQRTANHRKGSRTIQRYDDFFLESEAFVLEICRDASGALSTFTGKIHRSLEQLLDDRNSFAHANFNGATEQEAKSYVERCIRVVSNAPFK